VGLNRSCSLRASNTLDHSRNDRRLLPDDSLPCLRDEPSCSAWRPNRVLNSEPRSAVALAK